MSEIDTSKLQDKVAFAKRPQQSVLNRIGGSFPYKRWPADHQRQIASRAGSHDAWHEQAQALWRLALLTTLITTTTGDTP